MEASSPLVGLPIVEAIEGLAATRSRSMGGEVAATLFAGCFSQVSQDLATARESLREKESEFQHVLQGLSDEKTKAAVLQERLDAMARSQHIKQVCILVGTATIGVAIDLYKNSQGLERLSYLVGALGVILLSVGYFAKRVGVTR
jgi:hypothetical protein